MATATATITADQMRLLGVSVNSSAMRSWALVQSNDGDPELLVLFNSGETVYRYAFRSWDDARAWDDLRAQDDACSYDSDAEPVSWGQQLHRRLKEGAILTV